MTVPAWREEAISKKHDRKSFDCGEPALNEFLQRYARQSHEAGGAKTFVAVKETDGKAILGCYSLAPAALAYADTPELMPCTVADIPVTTKTPTAMPRIVNAARTLLVRMESKAIATPSDNIFNRSRIVTASLGAKRDDRIELRGAAGRIDACRDANAAA